MTNHCHLIVQQTQMLTDPGDLVVDFFGGSNTTGRAAEELCRRWLSFELDPDYAALSVVRFMADLDHGSIAQTIAAIVNGETARL